MGTGTIDPTDEEAVLARAAEIQAGRAAKALGDRKDRYAPLVAMVDGPEYAHVRSAVPDLVDRFSAEPTLAGALRALGPLLQTIAMQIPVDVRTAGAGEPAS